MTQSRNTNTSTKAKGNSSSGKPPIRLVSDNGKALSELANQVLLDKPQRRRHLRVLPKAEDPVRIDINGGNFIEILTATDISEGGLGIQVKHGFQGCSINDSVSFVIELPISSEDSKGKNTLVRLHGKIRHVTGDRFGVSFSPVSDSNRKAIKGYVASRLREQSWVQWLKYKTGMIR
ncbi:MAG: PilZ domain-containing protein [Cellvibrionaceae bacterium]